MRPTMGEAAALLLIALPNLISALPVNTGADVEQLIPFTSTPGAGKRAIGDVETLVPVTQLKRDLEQLIPITPSNLKRDGGDVEVLVPIVGRDIEKLVPITPGHSKREVEKLIPITHLSRDVGDLEKRKTIPPVDQLDPGSVPPDAISSVQKRKIIPPADQLDPGSITPDNIQKNNKREEYAHTETVIATVLKTVTRGFGIPEYPTTVVSDITSVHISIVTHLPSTITAVVTAGASSSTKESIKTSETITSKSTPSDTRKPVGPSGTGTFGTGKNGAHPSETENFHLSGTGDVSSKTRVTTTSSVKPSASDSTTTTIVGTSTTRIYTTVTASGKPSSKTHSGINKGMKAENGGGSTFVEAAGPTGVKSSSGSSDAKIISTSVSVSASHTSSIPGLTKSVSLTNPIPATSTSTSSAHISSSTSVKAVASAVASVKHTTSSPSPSPSQSHSSSKKPTATSETVKPSRTAIAAPAMTSKIVYTGVPKVYHF